SYLLPTSFSYLPTTYYLPSTSYVVPTTYYTRARYVSPRRLGRPIVATTRSYSYLTPSAYVVPTTYYLTPTSTTFDLPLVATSASVIDCGSSTIVSQAIPVQPSNSAAGDTRTNGGNAQPAQPDRAPSAVINSEPAGGEPALNNPPSPPAPQGNVGTGNTTGNQ